MSAIITVGVYEGNPDSGLGSVADHYHLTSVYILSTNFPQDNLLFSPIKVESINRQAGRKIPKSIHTEIFLQNCRSF